MRQGKMDGGSGWGKKQRDLLDLDGRQKADLAGPASKQRGCPSAVSLEPGFVPPSCVTECACMLLPSKEKAKPKR